MKAKIKVLFYLRKSKVNAQGLMPIFQRITINGQRFEVSTGHYVGNTTGAATIVPLTASKANPMVLKTLKNFGVGAFALSITFIMHHFKIRQYYNPLTEIKECLFILNISIVYNTMIS